MRSPRPRGSATRCCSGTATRPARRRRGDRPRRLLLRRLPARRRARALLADHGRGRALRPPRRAGARHLQRLPGAVRGGAAAGRAAAEHVAALRLPPGRCSTSSTRTRSGPARARAATGSRSRPSTRPAATGRPTRCSTSSRPNGQVVLRYATGNGFNGSARDIAGVCNRAGNVVGLMPHPEHAVDPLTGSADGLAAVRVGRARRRLMTPPRRARADRRRVRRASSR